MDDVLGEGPHLSHGGFHIIIRVSTTDSVENMDLVAQLRSDDGPREGKAFIFVTAEFCLSEQSASVDGGSGTRQLPR